MLQFLQVKKEYAGNLIISISEWVLPEGIYWLKGANGSGKTTLLKIVGGLIPFSGNILLHGISLHRKPAGYRYLQSYAEAEPSFPPFLTGQELIRFIRDIRKVPNTAVAPLIEQLDFGKHLTTPVGVFSSGMMKRLSLILSFIGHPKLILLDEPMANLDNDASAILPKIMMEYHKTYGCSFIFSSHTSLQEELPITGNLLLQDQHMQYMA